jgi:hypothetical protein
MANRAVRYLVVAACLSLATACAMLAPSQSGVTRAGKAAGRQIPSPAPAALAIVGDVGTFVPEVPRLVAAIVDRTRDAPQAPVLVLGDVFYRDGLLGLCPASGDPPRSKHGCEAPTDPSEQVAAVFEPYRRGLAARPLVAVAGNHDHRGDPTSTRNACELLPEFVPGWTYLAQDCGLEASHPVHTLDLGDLVVFVLDSERMIDDGDYRHAATTALQEEVSRYRKERPDAWRVVALHHPLETYGLHNGATLPTAVHKDLYWLGRTALFPLSFVLERTLLPGGAQNVYEWGYRGFRRALYRALRDAPVDLIVSGHDHSLQLVRLHQPGVGHQLVSGAGAYRTPVKRWGLDLFFLNRLARLVGLGRLLPAPRHQLLFGAGEDVGLGFAVLVPDREQLWIEIYRAASPEPLLVYAIDRD